MIIGYSFEVCFYVEDVGNNFLFVIGWILYLKFLEGCCVDSGVRVGDEILFFYDLMVVKLIIYGVICEIVLVKMCCVLGEMELVGIVMNFGFLVKLVVYEGFVKGDVDMGLIVCDYEVFIEVEGVIVLLVV